MKKTSKEWSLHQLDELLTVVSGQVDPHVAPFRDMPNIGGDNIESHSGKLSGVRTPAELGLQSGKYLFKPTDVLYSKIRPYLNKVLIPGFSGVCSADIYALRVDESKLDRHYLVYLLRSDAFLTYTEKHSTRTNIPKINRPALLSFSTYFPPLEEQRRIAAILDKADAVRRKRKEAIALTEELLRSAFLEMFGDPVTNPKGWEKIKLADAVDLVNGRAFKPSEWTTQGLPIIRIQNLKSPDAKYNYYNGDFQEKFRVKPGDLLLSWSGQLVSFGVFIWQGSEGVLNQHIFNVHPRMSFELEYLEFALGSVVEMSKSKFHGIEMKHLTKEELNAQTVLYPPIQLQTEFALKIRHLRGMKDKQNTQQCDLDNLFNSLLQRAFRGEL